LSGRVTELRNIAGERDYARCSFFGKQRIQEQEYAVHFVPVIALALVYRRQIYGFDGTNCKVGR
jgi:hypothetical protein